MRIPFLSSFFSAKAATPERLENKNDNLFRLKKWMSETAETITRDLDANKKASRYIYTNNIDTMDFTRKDMEAVQGEFFALHDLCKERNVGLCFAGFDILPSEGFSTESSWSLRPLVSIRVDKDVKYNVYSHPLYGSPFKPQNRTP